MNALQFLRSLAFNIYMYVFMAGLGIVFFPWAAFSSRGARTACTIYANHIVRMAAIMVGLKSEVRGPVPQGEVMVAAKHQSFLDILIIFAALPRPKFIMKAELMYAPVLGQYAYRLGCVPVNRGKRGKAVAKMLEDVQRGRREPGQLCIYPQGTRVAPGVPAPYKIGTHVLYEQLGQDCVPVATNVGVFWPKRGVMRRPGTCVVEFLEPIQPGLGRREFMKQLEDSIEGASNRLNDEAGFVPPAARTAD
ncbi:1-acyl-sn-glycerol-3-phosphate acyltransferase [Palleronia salina]|uniref:1-acyl-sn-glycerol-3-phosphate acyltransferase n=1 Tax=Palleronia salina TaxID=313368 RepID=A0A1M6DM99_9RHOB|nr:lysophospholipid acyltransferase family protein [Palleronia salina]SHI74322.1 1-acyl-sn-glycerol-3-phosphate acyltransferase [Palleronia salina]